MLNFTRHEVSIPIYSFHSSGKLSERLKIAKIRKVKIILKASNKVLVIHLLYKYLDIFSLNKVKVHVGTLSCYLADKRADVMQKVSVRVVENSICREWYASQGKSTRVESQQMCAGHEEGGRDTCWVSSYFTFTIHLSLYI